MDYVALFNEVIKIARPAGMDNITLIQTEHDQFRETGLDSLDMMMIAYYFCEMFGIDDEKAKTFQPINVHQLKLFIEEHKTLDHDSVASALGAIK
jgi:acyl carrier protein